jgi:hypothetical protein
MSEVTRTLRGDNGGDPECDGKNRRRVAADP